MEYLWGENKYGPFSAGEDGYPNAGEVVRSFRILRSMSAAKFAELYSQALGEKKPKTRIWVLRMEKTNNVPVDIARRRAICDILEIPYVLLGISTALSKIPATDAQLAVPRISKQETLAAEILTEHEQALTTYFNGYYHRHGQAAMDEVTRATQQVSALLSLSTREQTHQRGITLISRYHRFGTKIAREQQQYNLAMNYADKAIEYAQEVHKVKPNNDLMAIAFSGRCFVSFEQESTRIDQPANYHAAVPYIDAALSHAQSATPLMKGLISLEWGTIHAYTAKTEKDRTEVQEMLAEGRSYIPEHQIGEDPNFIVAQYAAGWYHASCAEALIALKKYTEAIGELELAEEFTPITFPRRFAIIDLLRAKAYVGLREYSEAVTSARDALAESTAVKSDYNIARIAHIYQQLREGGYKRSSDLTELGRELEKTHPHLVRF